ncbi:MAG TPA: hypothetical protein VIJ29_04545 [Candidatus Paceibacterota bacterium]
MKKMVERKGFAGGVSAALFLFLTATAANAQTLCDPLGTNCQPGTESFSTVATAVAAFLFWDIATPLSAIMVLVGAFQLITSAGEPEKISQGRKTLLYAVIGFAIALLAGSVVNIIKNFIGAS